LKASAKSASILWQYPILVQDFLSRTTVAICCYFVKELRYESAYPHFTKANMAALAL
jgi:hypothetical protein